MTTENGPGSAIGLALSISGRETHLVCVRTVLDHRKSGHVVLFGRTQANLSGLHLEIDVFSQFLAQGV